MNAQYLQSSVESAGQFELLLEDSDHQVGAHRDPYLGLHRVGTRAIVVFDPQVPLDPAEEQLDAPSQFVEHGHGERRDFEVVCQEDEFSGGFRIVIPHSAQEHREVLAGLLQLWLSNMIAAQTGQAVHRLRVVAGELKVGLGAGDEKRSRPGDQRQSDEVHVATIHQIERSRLEEQTVEPANVVLPGAGDVDTCGDRAAQVDLASGSAKPR